MAGWRAADQEPVASRMAIGRGMDALVDVVARLADHGERPTVAVCWQDEAYLDVPPGVLARLAAVADVTVACVGRPQHGAMADHVEHITLEPGEALASEWSIVALTGTTGVALVAREVPASLPAATIEDGRAFRFDATDDPLVVVAHARRLIRAFGARMQPATAARFAERTADVDAGAAAPHEADVLTVSVAHAIATADDARRERAPLPHDAGGLVGLSAWLADAGPRSPSLGMIVLRSSTPGLTAALRDHADVIGRVGDIVVDVPPDAAMIVLPGLSGEALRSRADEVKELVAELLSTRAVDVLAVDVPAEQARRDLVGSLGAALARLRGANSRA